jgi:antitoxin component of MazEF toxin-antitoxin module
MQTDILITNILPTKTAFGIVADGSEAVFIPSRVADAADVRIGQTVKALLVPNQTQPEKTPWMAVFIGEKNDEDTLAEDIKADLERGPATAREVAFSIDRPVELVARKMREMNQAGLLKSEPLYDLIASNAEGNA